MYGNAALCACLPPGLMPKCYYSYSSTLWGEYTILLEDCGPDVTPVNFVFGNQVRAVCGVYAYAYTTAAFNDNDIGNRTYIQSKCS